MTKDIADYLDWAKQLGCPPSALTEDVKKILNHGLMNFVWDEISSVILPVEDVIESRKNILLNSLQSQVSVPAIQHLKKIETIKSERAIIKSQVEQVENEYKAISDSLAKKGLKIAKLKHQQEKAEIKTGALKYKQKKIEKEIKLCKDFISECNNVMPESKYEVDDAAVNHCLKLAGLVSSREDKYEALKQIDEDLGSVGISELWDILLSKAIQDTEKLTKLHLEQETYEVSRPFKEIWKICAATFDAEIVSASLDALIHLKVSNANVGNGTRHINNLMVNDSEDMLSWIQLNMEDVQLHTNLKIFQSYLEHFRNLNSEMNYLPERESELMNEIYIIDIELEDILATTRISLSSVKSCGQFLLKLNQSLNDETVMIDALNSQYNLNFDSNNLASEIEEFHKNTDVNALDKVLLRDKVGDYRHASMCMSKVLLVTPNVTSATPVFNSPLGHLICCLRNIIANSLLKQQLEQDNLKCAAQQAISIGNISTDSSKYNDIYEILDKIKSINTVCEREIKNLEAVYDAWASQPVQQAMSVINDTVGRLTYEEWVKKYTSLLYLLTRNK